MKKSLPVVLSLFTVLVLAGKLHAQMVTQGGFTPTYLTQNVLIGNGLTATSISFQGNTATQIRKFRALGTTLGLDSGIVLSTTPMTNNNVFSGSSTGVTVTGGAGTAGYALLNQYTQCGATFNAAVLQFNFTPLGDTIKFRYVFASEEYNEFVNTQFNDVFAFFLSGPKPGGGNYVNQNIAIVPNTVNTPVSISNVNNGQAGGCTPGTAPSNPAYYHDNCVSSPAPFGIVFDGFTVPMTAIAPVIPCSTYTIRLAVADACDNILNSAVFLEANSFSSTGFQLSVSQNSVSSQDTILYEGCGNAKLVITRTNNFNQTITVPVNIGGTATNGVDYLPIPTSITFLPGQISDTIDLQPVYDLIPEPDETMTITVSSNMNCISSSASKTFIIRNYTPLSIDAGNDTIMTCVGGTLTAHVTGGVPHIQLNWDNGASNSATYTINPTAAAWHYLTAVDTCGNSARDSVYVDYWAPEFVGYSIGNPTPPMILEGCGNGTVIVYRTENTNQARTYPIDITGTATNGTDYTTVSNTITFNPGDTAVVITIEPTYDMVNEPSETFIITVTDTLCDGTLVPFTQTVTINNLDPVAVDAGPDILIDCPRSAVDIQPVYSLGATPYTYSWDNGMVTNNINVLPPDTSTYIITVTDNCGYTDQDTITINIAHDPVAGYDFNDIIYCEPATVDFLAQSLPVSGLNLNYLWTFGDGGGSANANPTHIFQTYGDYPVTLVVTNDYGCQDSIQYTVTVKPVPTAVPMFNPQNPSTLSPEVTFWDESYPNIQTWYWETGDGGVYNSNTFKHTYATPGQYTGYLQVVNEWGCSDSTHFTVIVEEETSIYIPNSFTPDGDGLNDVFELFGTNWRTMEFRVFDRWGGEVFFSDNPDKHWNGKMNNTGDRLMNGTYAYKLYIIDFYGKEYSFMGHINLLR